MASKCPLLGLSFSQEFSNKKIQVLVRYHGAHYRGVSFRWEFTIQEEHCISTILACICDLQMNRTETGTMCNRAIMIITDGAPDNYEEIFRLYNWPNKDVRI